MTHARTLTRYACLAGLIAGLLAPVSSLAQGFPSGHPYHSSNSRANIAAKYGIAMSQQSGTAMVEVGYRARHTGLPGGVTRYTNGRALIPAATIRTGALSALSRGVRHPGFQIAVLAAGFIIANDGNIYSEFFDPDDNEFSSYDGSSLDTFEAYRGRFGNNSPCYSENMSAVIACFKPFVMNWYGADGAELSSVTLQNTNEFVLRFGWWKHHPPSSGVSINYFYGISPNDNYEPYNPAPVPITDSELAEIDPHIPPELVDELWADSGSIPEWEEAITMLPFDNIFAEGNTTSEVYQSARQANENLYAQLSGEPEPNPDQTTIGGTAGDEMVDMWNQPIPDFPEAEPEWQVEEITTLPDFSFGLGAGSCPAPVTIPHPLGGSFTIEFQKLCDLASMIRGAVIAICMILALYIVLGTRATTS